MDGGVPRRCDLRRTHVPGSTAATKTFTFPLQTGCDQAAMQN
jgi:hypothetical protein